MDAARGPRVLVISGAAGVGKSTTAFEVSALLSDGDVGHGLIDTDELDRIFPVPPDLAALTERNLRGVWEGLRERGVERLILVGVHFDRAAELEWVARAVPGATFTLVRLVASERTTLDRVRRRELGSGLEAQLTRTRLQMQEQAADRRTEVHVVAADGRTVTEVARDVLAVAGWGADGAGARGSGAGRAYATIASMPPESRHLTESIERPAAEVYDFAANPANLPRWAPGLGTSVEQIDGRWFVETASGRVGFAFVERNDFGVLDHEVTLPSGDVVYNPMRVVPYGDGCEVVFTVRRLPGMSEADFARDCALVQADLTRLKRGVEAGA